MQQQMLLASAIYTPPATDPYWANVISLLHFDGTDASTTFTDEVSGTTWTATSGAELDTATSRFGSASGLFPVSVNSGYGRIDSNTDAGFALGSGDWTIEGFIRLTGSKTGARVLLDQRPLANGLYPTIYVNGNTLVFYTNSAARITSTAGTITVVGTWQHWAVCKASGTTRLFIDGTQSGGNYTDGNTYVGSKFRYGNTSAADNFDNIINGWLDECRITKGVARYTSNFTPPSAPFPNS